MNNIMRKVTVVIPTYKRAHLLMETIPTYLQPDVEQLILVDDCSPDDTPAVAMKLVSIYPNIRYLRNEINLKQTVSKNRGKALAKTEYIYFGDDDSVLSENGISLLLETAVKFQSEIVGASAVYLKSEDDVLANVLADRDYANNIENIVNLPKLAFNFTLQSPDVLVLPVCHAAFLVRSDLAKAIDFDDGYIGNCFREETDFLLRCRSRKAKIVFDSRVTQTNLPPTLATGGARGRSRLVYEGYSLYNTVRFIIKNRFILNEIDSRCHPISMILNYFFGRIRSAFLRIHAIRSRCA